MIKNGNTVVPGDSVEAVSTNRKVASTRRGVVKDAALDGNVKVAWDDGTESWCPPDTLTRRD